MIFQWLFMYFSSLFSNVVFMIWIVFFMWYLAVIVYGNAQPCSAWLLKQNYDIRRLCTKQVKLNNDRKPTFVQTCIWERGEMCLVWLPWWIVFRAAIKGYDVGWKGRKFIVFLVFSLVLSCMVFAFD